MGKKLLLLAILIVGLAGPAAAVTVTVATPVNRATVASPVTVQASATSSALITGWRIYVDGSSVYQAGAMTNISASITMSTGTHQVIVRAWDSTGAYGSSNLQLTVASTISSTVSVTVAAPVSTTVSSPVTFNASAASGYTITGWQIYIDGVSAYSAGAATSISTPVIMTAGTHQAVIRAWNSTGAYGSASLTLTVAAPAPAPTGPVPPSNATTYTNLENQSGWGQCSSSSCSGGSATASAYWMAQYQTTPSLDGSSTEFYISGSAYATDLFWLKVANNSAVSHFIHDFYVYVDQTSTVEALEFDLFHVYNSQKYMFATECNYWTQTWDVWNESTQHWIHSNAVCTPFAPGVWHHVQWAVERYGAQTHYLTVTVDGATQTIADTYAYQPSTPTTWQNGNIGVQIQQDLSANPGSGIHEWIDKETVYAW